MSLQQHTKPMQDLSSRSQTLLVFAVVLSISLLLFGALVYFDVPSLADENHHVKQIRMFLNGDFQQLPTLTTIPGYHAVLALVAQFSSLHALNHLRAFSLFFGLAAILTFYACAQILIPERAAQRTLAFFLLPIFFPYLGLVYLHTLSMLLILLGVLSYLKQRYALVPLFLGLGVLVRQTNIIWVLMFLVMSYLETQEGHTPDAWVKKHALTLVGYTAIILGFGMFILWNGGVAMGDQEKHHIGLRIENLAFFLFLFCLLFWPFLAANVSQVLSTLRQHTRLASVFSLSFALLYLFLFRVSHPYNFPDIFLHNRLIKSFHATPFNAILSLLPMLIALWGFFGFRLQRRPFYLLYLFGVLSLLPFDLIEHRYYIPMMALFLLCKDAEEAHIEWGLTAYFFILSAVLCLALPLAGVFP